MYISIGGTHTQYKMQISPALVNDGPLTRNIWDFMGLFTGKVQNSLKSHNFSRKN